MSESINTTNIVLSSNFKSDLSKGAELTMFYIKLSNDSQNVSTNTYYKIATDQIDKSHLVIILDRSFISPKLPPTMQFGGDDSDNGISGEGYSSIKFYYRMSLVYKLAFTLDIPDETNESLYNYRIYGFAKNIILLDLSNVTNLNFEFSSAYVYDSTSLTPAPVYQHYHKIDKKESMSSANAVDSSIFKGNIELLRTHKNIDYNPSFDNEYPLIKNNRFLPNDSYSVKLVDKLDPSGESQLTNNSNQSVIFDNTETELSATGDEVQTGDFDYPLLTLYGSKLDYDYSDDYYILTFYND